MQLADAIILWLVGFIVTLGFAVLFNVPKKALMSVSVIGAFGLLLRGVMKADGVILELATLCGSLFIGLAGFWQARRINTPRLVFTITGIIAMVPGVPAYEMLLYFRNYDVLQGMQSGFKVALITGAIAGGLSLARALTELEWRTVEEHADD